MDYYRQIDSLATWEIDTLIELYGKNLIDRYSDIFSKNQENIRKLHRCRNTFSKDEYNIFVNSPIFSYDELISNIKKEVKPISESEKNLGNPIFDSECLNSECSYGIRIQHNSRITSSFLISYCLEFYENEVFENNCDEGDVSIIAGELNHVPYGKLNDYYFDLIIGKGLTSIKHINCFAGPHLSCPNDFDIKEGSVLDSNYFIKLFLDNKYQDKIRLYKVEERKDFHFIVHEHNNKLCLVEDPHLEFNERATTVVFNNPALCNKLRDMAQSYYSDSVPLLTEEDIRACLMTEDEIIKRTSHQN